MGPLLIYQIQKSSQKNLSGTTPLANKKIQISHIDHFVVNNKMVESGTMPEDLITPKKSLKQYN